MAELTPENKQMLNDYLKFQQDKEELKKKGRDWEAPREERKAAREARRGLVNPRTGMTESERKGQIATGIMGGLAGVSESVRKGLGTSVKGWTGDPNRVMDKTSMLMQYLSGKGQQRLAQQAGQGQPGLQEKMSEEEKIQRRHKIEGFDYKSKAIQSDAAIREFRERVAATGGLIDGMSDLKNYVEQSSDVGGVINPLSAEGEIAQQRLMGLFGELKDYLELGVLQQADEELMRKMIPDATKLTRLFKQGKVSELLTDMQKVWGRGTKRKLDGLGWKMADWKYASWAKDQDVKEKYIKGKVYPGKKGTKARYLGDGKWELVN